jgi:hypothetical protein
MKKAYRWILLVLPVALACAPGEDPRAGDPPGEPVVTGGPQNAGMGVMTAPIAMRGVDGSGVTGQATISPRGEASEITVQLWGHTPGEHPGEIRQGSCLALGPVVDPLPNMNVIDDGSGGVEAVVERDTGVLFGGEHVIVYYDAGTGAPVACGELTPHGPAP